MGFQRHTCCSTGWTRAICSVDSYRRDANLLSPPCAVCATTYSYSTHTNSLELRLMHKTKTSHRFFFQLRLPSCCRHCGLPGRRPCAGREAGDRRHLHRQPEGARGAAGSGAHLDESQSRVSESTRGRCQCPSSARPLLARPRGRGCNCETCLGTPPL